MTDYVRSSGLNLAIVLAIIGTIALGCDAWVEFDGIVITEKGEGVANARIQVYNGKTKVREVTSEKDGAFHVFNNIAPFGNDIRIVVSKEGFREQEVKLERLNDGPNGKARFRTVILQR